MLKWLLIAVGGACGSLLRYAFQGWVQRLAGSSFPVGTLAVNVTACLVIGFLSGFFASVRIGGNSSPSASRPDDTRYLIWLTICR